MRRIGIAICLLSLWAAPVWAEDNNPDPPDDTETVCPEDYHPVEGLDGFCAQNDGTGDGDEDCPGGWSNISDQTDFVCQCLGNTDASGNCGPSDPYTPPSCPPGWYNYAGTGVCIPNWMGGGPPGQEPCSRLCDKKHGTCYCPPPRVVVVEHDDISVFNAEFDLLVHYNLDPEKGCAVGQAYDYVRNACFEACTVLDDVPCTDAIGDDVVWIFRED